MDLEGIILTLFVLLGLVTLPITSGLFSILMDKIWKFLLEHSETEAKE